MTDFIKDKIEERRLRILEAIATDDDEAMSETRIKAQLDLWAWKAPIEAIQQDLHYLKTVGAIRVIEANDILVGVMAQLGRQHLAREALVVGVQRARPKF